jgi:DNA repair protein RecO (recombination protein O)
MALVSTAAIVLHAIKYGETSKIVKLATRDYGLQSAIAKGAGRPKSRFGAQLETLSQGTAHLYLKPTRELQTLAGFEVLKLRPGLAGEVRRYAAAQVLVELVLRCAPAEPQASLFDFLSRELDRLAEVPSGLVDETALGAVWQLVSILGFAPQLDCCARDGRGLGAGRAHFSVSDGGLVCPACAAGRKTSVLTLQDREALERFLAGVREPPLDLSARHAAAHRRLVARFVRYHLAEGREFKALDFWERLPWRAT